MTTKKHKVSAYLTDDEFEVLKGLATQYQVSQSQIVILAIRELAKLGQVELMELPVSYLPNAISGVTGVTKEDMVLLVKNEVKTAIAELQTNFENQLGEFKSLVFDTAPTLETMNAAIKAAIKSNSESGVTKELLETVTEGKPEKKTITEIMPSQDSPITLETYIQDVSPINQGKEPETLPILDVITVSTDDLPTDDKPQRELLKDQTHAQVAEITRKKLSTIGPYFSKGKIAQGRGRAFKPNKKTMLWDEIKP
jgi:hypothetical protein